MVSRGPGSRGALSLKVSSLESAVLVVAVFALVTLLMALLGQLLYDALRRWWQRRRVRRDLDRGR